MNLPKALGVWLFACVCIHLLYRLSFISWIWEVSPLLIALILFYFPVLFLKKQVCFFYLEKNRKDILYSLKIFLIFSLLVLPLFFVANHFFQSYFFNAQYHSQIEGGFQDPHFWIILFNQILLIALPEEYFFRVFLLNEMQSAFPASPQSPKLFGVKLSAAFFLNALLFAFSHSLIQLQWWHFAIFFPSLAFGWLRQKTGGLIAPTLFHASCNMANFWIAKHYF